MRALVVEDNPGMRELVVEILILWGYEVHAVGDGEEAVRHLRKHASKTDLIITDYRMPRMDGLHLTRHTKEVAPGIKVIMMSGDDPNEIEEAAREAGAGAFIRKPFSMETLWAAIVSVFP
jgi:two-component system, cell cycle sensor histidine kinase and response regulator CckA